MGLGYSLPGQLTWDPLGSWAARLPSALASISVMLGLADTLLRWPFSRRLPPSDAHRLDCGFGVRPCRHW